VTARIRWQGHAEGTAGQENLMLAATGFPLTRMPVRLA
jgi:hypothetical protein